MIIKKLVSRRNHAAFSPYGGSDELTGSETSDQTDSGENQSGNWAMINSHNYVRKCADKSLRTNDGKWVLQKI